MSRYLGNLTCVKSEDNRALLRDNEIRTTWRKCFHKLYRSPNRGIGLMIHFFPGDILYFSRVTKSVGRGIRKMKIRKSLDMTIYENEVLKCVGERRIVWLTKLFINILKPRSMPDELRKSTFGLYKKI